MDTLKVSIEKIKNIENGNFEIPLESGVYSLVGTNGCGKSTVLLSVAQLISKHYLGTLKKEDYQQNSKITYTLDNTIDTWAADNKGFWTSDIFPKSIKFNGLY